MASEFLILWPVLVQAVGAASGEHQKEEESIYSRALQGTPIKDPVFVGDSCTTCHSRDRSSRFSPPFGRGAQTLPPFPKTQTPWPTFGLGGGEVLSSPKLTWKLPKPPRKTWFHSQWQFEGVQVRHAFPWWLPLVTDIPRVPMSPRKGLIAP